MTRIEWDGTMQRRVVDTAFRTDGPRWEGLATRALLLPPPYDPVPGAPVYHVSLDNSMVALAAERDLCGPLLDLVTAVLALGEELLARLPSLTVYCLSAEDQDLRVQPVGGWRGMVVT